VTVSQSALKAAPELARVAVARTAAIRALVVFMLILPIMKVAPGA
jgi:hypothetical protein